MGHTKEAVDTITIPLHAFLSQEGEAIVVLLVKIDPLPSIPAKQDMIKTFGKMVSGFPSQDRKVPQPFPYSTIQA